jgi:hypothetical protein
MKSTAGLAGEGWQKSAFDFYTLACDFFDLADGAQIIFT